MQHSKRRHEGYVIIDNSASLGTSQCCTDQTNHCTDQTNHNRYNSANTIMVGEGNVFEANTITCEHCQRGVILNSQRSHSREWCAKCDHYLCDNCGLIKKIDGQCRNFNKLLDKLQEIAFKELL